MFDNEIYGIIRDDQDHLWMACSKGLFSVNRTDLLEFAAGKRKKIVSTPYSPTDALRTIECRSGVQPGSARMQDGRVWFSTIRGLYVFDPNHLTLNIPPPPVVIEETTVNGERVEPAAIAAIPPGLKNLEFTYSGLTFLQPNRITFRYMLEGFDKKWIEAGTRREAFYTNLPPGKYRFRVIGCNADGFCNETGASDCVFTGAAFLSAVVVPAAVRGAAGPGGVDDLSASHPPFAGAVQYDSDRAEPHRAGAARHADSGPERDHDGDAGAGREAANAGGARDARGYRSRRGHLFAGDAQVSGGTAQPAGSESGLASAIAQAAKHITEAKAVKLKLKLDKSPTDMSPEVQYNLLRIASEAVNNSVKHSGAKTIEVVLQSTPEMLQLSVKDDGSGFSRENGNVRPGHYGLIGMKERAAQIGAELNLASEPGRGTTISVMLPTKVSPPKQAGPERRRSRSTHT